MSVVERKRIIFLDMMRAFAVLMMVQGHTIDAFLADQFRTFDSTAYYIWNTMRGFTAPVFMFSSGVVFTYLLRLYKEPFFKNPRVRKGLIRFVTLVTIGYMLRYPTYTVFNFGIVTELQWKIFFTVDALHLIGFGLLFILILALAAEKLKLSDYFVFVVGALFFFILHSITEQIKWTNFLPIPFAAYFYHGTGSYFPFFPWAGYVLTGAILGSYLSHNPESFNSKKFGVSLLLIGSGLLIISYLLDLTRINFFNGSSIWLSNFNLITLRTGYVILLNGIMAYIALRVKTIPHIVKQTGKYTLPIYVVHVVILYGSAWVPGLSLFFSRSMNITNAIIAAIIMVLAMLVMALGIEKFRAHKKNKPINATK